ncbi:MAG: tRNA (guanosine(37)-N1)-methyltransferase TrmD, partial [Stenotrophomonas maltophilia]
SSLHAPQVPDVLLSGDHGRIDEWRKEQSRLRTGS